MVSKLTLLLLLVASLASAQYAPRTHKFVVPDNSLTGTAAAVTYHGLTGTFNNVTGSLDLYGGLGSGSLTNVSGPGLSVDGATVVLSTNNWVLGQPLGVSGGVLTLQLSGGSNIVGLATNDVRLTVAALTNGFLKTLTAGSGVSLSGSGDSRAIQIDPATVLTNATEITRLTTTNGDGFVQASSTAITVSPKVSFPAILSSNVWFTGGKSVASNAWDFFGTVTFHGDKIETNTINQLTVIDIGTNYHDYSGTNYYAGTITNYIYQNVYAGTNRIDSVGTTTFNNSWLIATNAAGVLTPHFLDYKGSNALPIGTWNWAGATWVNPPTNGWALGGTSGALTNSTSSVSGLTLTSSGGIVTLGGSIPASGDALTTNNVNLLIAAKAITNNGVSINGQYLSNGSSLTIVSGDGLTTNDVRGIVNATNATIQTQLAGKLATNGVAVSAVYATNAGSAVSATYAASAGYATNAGTVTVAGDVTGSSAATTVGKLQGYTVSSSAPGEGTVLRYTGGSWTPQAVSNLTSSLGLTNVEFSFQVPGGWLFGPSTNTVSVVGQGEYLALQSAASTIDLRLIKPQGFSGSNVAVSVWIPSTSTATQTISLAVCVNQPYPQAFLASTNLSFAGSGVATNRVTQTLIWDGLRTNGTAGDVLWFRLTGSANSTNWPEVLRIW